MVDMNSQDSSFSLQPNLELGIFFENNLYFPPYFCPAIYEVLYGHYLIAGCCVSVSLWKFQTL